MLAMFHLHAVIYTCYIIYTGEYTEHITVEPD
jgi:hypothetical protein